MKRSVLYTSPVSGHNASMIGVHLRLSQIRLKTNMQITKNVTIPVVAYLQINMLVYVTYIFRYILV